MFNNPRDPDDELNSLIMQTVDAKIGDVACLVFHGAIDSEKSKAALAACTEQQRDRWETSACGAIYHWVCKSKDDPDFAARLSRIVLSMGGV